MLPQPPAVHPLRQKRGEVPALMEACLQVHPLLPPFRLLQALLWCFLRVGLGISVHDTYAVNTVCPVLPDATDQ